MTEEERCREIEERTLSASARHRQRTSLDTPREISKSRRSRYASVASPVKRILGIVGGKVAYAGRGRRTARGEIGTIACRIGGREGHDLCSVDGLGLSASRDIRGIHLLEETNFIP